MGKMYSWSNNGMKMIIDTGYKEFDKQTNLLSSGNVISNTQYSSYIRPYNEIKNPVGEKVKEGYLRDYDLQYFSNNRMPKSFKEWLNAVTQTKKVIVYEYFIYRNREKDIIGWLVQDTITESVIGRMRNLSSRVRQKNQDKVLSFCKEFLETER